MKILIIGGSGHVSGTLAQSALKQGHQVWAVTRGTRPVSNGVRSLIADRADNAAFEAVIKNENITWDLVVDCICYNRTDMRVDIDLFPQVAKQFVFISTDFVFDPEHRKFPQPEESTYWAGGNEGTPSYGANKRLCEIDLLNSDIGEMAWTIIRPCHIYGPTSELGCLPLHGRDPDLIRKMRAGEPLQLVGGGHFLQQPILAADLAEMILSTAGNSGAFNTIFNAAGPDIIESRQYYQIIADVLGVGLKVEEIPVDSYLAENPGQKPFMCHRIYNLDHIKACKLKVPSTSIEEGLEQHVEGLIARKGL